MNELLQEIFQTAVIPFVATILGIATKYVTAFISAKIDEVKTRTDNEKFNNCMIVLDDAICNAVESVNHTFVDALKSENAFTKENWSEAMNKTLDILKLSLSTTTKKILMDGLEVTTDEFNTWLTTKVESYLKISKSSSEGVVLLEE